MILKIFSLMDHKAGCFGTPFFFPSSGQAVRAVIDLASDLQTLVGRHPADFALYEIGSWDDGSCRFEQGQYIHLGLVSELLPRTAPTPLFGDQP